MVGRGGLLGSAVAERCGTTFDPGAIAWHDTAESSRALTRAAQDFRDAAGVEDWAIVWAAGTATTSSSAEDAERELIPLDAVATAVRDRAPSGRGVFLLASSVGGVYAGSADPPFTIASPPMPLSPYGRLKLDQEALVSARLAGTCAVRRARFSNLYGPGQNLDKLQGLISRLALSAVTQKPINIFVPLDTIRDYIHVDDAAEAVLQTVDLAVAQGTGTTVEIIASGQPTTVGTLVRTMGSIARRRIPVALGTHPSAAAQAPALTVIPTVAPQTRTPLPEGMKDVYLDVLARAQDAGLTA